MAESTEQKLSKPFVDDQQIIAVQNELEIIKSLNCPILSSLGNFEIDRLRGGIADYVDLISNKKVKVRAKIDIPADQYPSTNFVGKLLGPGASTLKSIQEQTNTKMTIRGIDNHKQKSAVIPDQCEKLHLQIDSLGTPAEAYYKLSHAVAEVQKCLTFNIPMGYGSMDPNVQAAVPMMSDYGMGGPRPYPTPMRGMARGAVRRAVRGGTRFIPPVVAPSAIDHNAGWPKSEESNGGQEFSYAGPLHTERNPNRVAPY